MKTKMKINKYLSELLSAIYLYVKSMLLLFILYYYTYHKIFNFMFTFLIYYCVWKLFQIKIDDNTFYNYEIIHNYKILKTMPSISAIKNHFYYKTDFINHYALLTSKLNINIINWQKHIYQLVIDKTNNNHDVFPYYPSGNISSYFPIIKALLGFKATFSSSYKHEYVIPTYEVTQPYFEETPLTKEKVKDIYKVSELPFEFEEKFQFEAPTMIKIELDDEDEDVSQALIFITQNTLTKDLFFSIFGPSYDGPQYFSHSQIFDLHLQIVEIMKRNLPIQDEDVVSHRDVSATIQNIVQDFISSNRLFSNLTVNDLQNRNHFINLLISEMLLNSLLTSEEESFILQQVTKRLIIEAIRHVANEDPSDEYVKSIVTRFLEYSRND